MKTKHTINQISVQVRKAMEKASLSINDIVRGDRETLECYCAIASETLKKVLKNNGIKSKMVVGYFSLKEKMNNDTESNHCWVEAGEWMIDITATQFHGISQKVIILSVKKAKGYYKMTRKQAAFEDWMDYQKLTPSIFQEIKQQLNVGLT